MVFARCRKSSGGGFFGFACRNSICAGFSLAGGIYNRVSFLVSFPDVMLQRFDATSPRGPRVTGRVL